MTYDEFGDVIPESIETLSDLGEAMQKLSEDWNKRETPIRLSRLASYLVDQQDFTYCEAYCFVVNIFSLGRAEYGE